MKLNSFFAAAGLLAILGSSVFAQQKTNVCIIDIAKVFESHPTFRQNLKKLQQEAEAFKAEIEQKRQQLNARKETILKMTPGSEQFKTEEANLAQVAARFEVDARNRIKEFGQREADLHYVTYQEIKGLIGQYSKSRGIAIVITHQNFEVDQANADSIMRWVNRQIVFHSAHKDITQPIIQYLAQARSAGNNVQNRK